MTAKQTNLNRTKHDRCSDYSVAPVDSAALINVGDCGFTSEFDCLVDGLCKLFSALPGDCARLLMRPNFRFGFHGSHSLWPFNLKQAHNARAASQPKIQTRRNTTGVQQTVDAGSAVSPADATRHDSLRHFSEAIGKTETAQTKTNNLLATQKSTPSSQPVRQTNEKRNADQFFARRRM